jgi:hypothetical protein
MSRNFQLTMPTPCHEDWESMRPEERGRFCEACSKTVVDFSMMTDREVMEYLGRAGRQVCGRMAPEQLDRDFAMAGEGRRRRGWWHWLVAGLLVTAEAKGQTASKGEIVKVDRMRKDVAPATMDSMKVQVLAPVTVTASAVTCHRTGAMMMVTTVTIWEKVVRDTLATAGVLPKRELTVYPNPVRRGTVLSLQWQRTDPGSYAVSLFNTAGSLVQQWKIEVGGREQVDLLSLPPALPAGMYLLHAVRPDGAKVITLRIILI